MVWELDGPTPILNKSNTLISMILSHLFFSHLVFVDRQLLCRRKSVPVHVKHGLPGDGNHIALMAGVLDSLLAKVFQIALGYGIILQPEIDAEGFKKKLTGFCKCVFYLAGIPEDSEHMAESCSLVWV
jgi:hypothetical protein